MGKMTQQELRTDKEKTSSETITPKIAESYLKKNTQNRQMSERKVARFAAIIEAGQWVVTHQGIAFDTAGVLVDGQHRLQAVVNTGATVTMMVTRNLSPGARKAIDTMGGRRPWHTIQILGGVEDARRATEIVGMIRYAVNGYKGEAHYDDVMECYRRYRAGIEWACENVPARGRLFSAPIAAGFAYAYPACSSLLVEIMPSWKSGTFTSPTDPVLRFRDHVAGLSTMQDHNIRADVFNKCLNAIYLRLHNRKQQRVTATQDAVNFFRKANGD